MKEGDDNEDKKSELEKALLQAKVDAEIATRESIKAIGQNSSAGAAPKKVNWDLKRDIAKKLNRLERRTQKVVIELLRARLEKEAEKGDDDDE